MFFDRMPTMKIYISVKTRQALLDAGFPRASIANWRSGRYKPSRMARQIIAKIMEENSRGKSNIPGNPKTRKEI
jgi:hypothetical protein